MRARFLVGAVLLLSACGSDTEPPGRDLSGVWVIDAERTLVEIDAWPMDDAMKDSARAAYSDESMPVTWRVEDGTVVIINEPGLVGPDKGTWSIGAKEGDTWTVVVQRDSHLRPVRMVVTWIDEDHVKIVAEGERETLVFKRKR